MKIYISGPMTGYPNKNFAAFDRAKESLEKKGYEVVSPADLERRRNPLPYILKIRADIGAMVECGGIYLLKNWRFSRGARIEYMIAMLLELEILWEESS